MFLNLDSSTVKENWKENAFSVRIEIIPDIIMAGALKIKLFQLDYYFQFQQAGVCVCIHIWIEVLDKLMMFEQKLVMLLL
jgi:hypothetical protein